MSVTRAWGSFLLPRLPCIAAVCAPARVKEPPYRAQSFCLASRTRLTYAESKRADERTRTADLISLLVRSHTKYVCIMTDYAKDD